METKFERIVGATISVRVDYQTLDDIVVTALEGGIGWWACLDNTGPEWDDEPEEMATSEYAALLIANGKNSNFLMLLGNWKKTKSRNARGKLMQTRLLTELGCISNLRVEQIF